jgi:hypothetical protein
LKDKLGNDSLDQILVALLVEMIRTNNCPVQNQRRNQILHGKPNIFFDSSIIGITLNGTILTLKPT